ncbi:MAG: SchA/CurD-like domain-containing protein [Acidimicrobiales bacterium]
MQRHAILFRIKPGSREAVRQLLSTYDPPRYETEDGTRLISTSIFMSGDTVVRMMEIDGALPSVMVHLAGEPSIQKLERDLDPHLLERRDMSTPDGARAFFRSAMMEHVVTRRAGAPVASGSAPGNHSRGTER